MSMLRARISRMFGIALLIGSVGTGCGGTGAGTTGGADASPPGTPDASPPGTPDGNPMPPGFTTLIAGDWTLAAGSEQYVCVRKTVTQDMYISAFHPIAPVGTHHTVLSIGSPSAADGTFACDVTTNSQGMIWASGVGTDDLTFPDGVAIKIAAGQQMNINLHLFNASDQTIMGTSGAAVKVVPVAQVQHEAEALLAGTLQVVVPPATMASPSTTLHGTCTMNSDVTIFGAWPHMHLLGTHIKSTANSSVMGAQVMLDRAYSFDNQDAYLLPTPIPMKSGDTVAVDCTYVNTTGATVIFGESTKNEMCFSGIYRYPKIGAGHVTCTN